MNARPLRAGILPRHGLRQFARLAAEAAGVGLAASVALLVAALLIASVAARRQRRGHRRRARCCCRERASRWRHRCWRPTSRSTCPASSPAHASPSASSIPPHGWREAVYVFPLPDDAAVDHLDVRVGERRIDGVIRERNAARKVLRGSEAVRAARPRWSTRSARTSSPRAWPTIGPGEAIGWRSSTSRRCVSTMARSAALSARDHAALHPRHAARDAHCIGRRVAGHRRRGGRLPDHATGRAPGRRQGEPGEAVGGHRHRRSARQDRQPLPPGPRDRSARPPVHGRAPTGRCPPIATSSSPGYPTSGARPPPPCSARCTTAAATHW